MKIKQNFFVFLIIFLLACSCSIGVSNTTPNEPINEGITSQKFTITWKNDDGTILKTNIVEEGEFPFYSGTPSKVSTDTTTYTFDHWEPSIEKI